MRLFNLEGALHEWLHCLQLSQDEIFHIYELFWFPSDLDIYLNEQNFTQILCKMSAIHNYLVAVGVSPWAGKFQEFLTLRGRMD